MNELVSANFGRSFMLFFKKNKKATPPHIICN